ncbi:MAG TPA: cupin domain-containing protein [Candidatus Lustribacter sp.]|nr:cupin domain-containing protein [Candidatus Lustribacter sp.]
MAETERTRTRERAPLAEDAYETAYRYRKEQAERQLNAPVVVRGEDCPVFLSRQGRLCFLLDPLTMPQNPLHHWRLFTHEVRTKSGRHRHQGGLVIYVVSGTGYSIVEGERIDWKKGSLLLLPMKPGGVEHQHFNLDPDKPSVWAAFVPIALTEHVASQMRQTETSPEFTQE